MLSKKDTDVICRLRSNSRLKLTELSRELDIPVTTLYSKLKNYEKKVIKKHTSLLDFPRLGYKSIFLVLKAREKRRELQEFLEREENINTLLRTNYDSDFLVEGIFRNEKEVTDFMEELQDNFIDLRIEMLNVVEEIKKEGFLSHGEGFREGKEETNQERNQAGNEERSGEKDGEGREGEEKGREGDGT